LSFLFALQLVTPVEKKLASKTKNRGDIYTEFTIAMETITFSAQCLRVESMLKVYYKNPFLLFKISAFKRI